MWLTFEQKEKILPYLKAAVQAQINLWDAQRRIERVLNRSIVLMSAGIIDLAVTYDEADEITIGDVQKYIDSCKVSKRP
jgi:hypothetical protein